MGNSPGLFDVDDWLRRLSKIGDHLEAYASAAVVRPGPDVQGPDRPGAEQSQRLIRHPLTHSRLSLWMNHLSGPAPLSLRFRILPPVANKYVFR